MDNKNIENSKRNQREHDDWLRALDAKIEEWKHHEEKVQALVSDALNTALSAGLEEAQRDLAQR